MTVGASDIAAAREAVADVVRRTPVVPSLTLEERCGAPVVLKAESLQRTGSFKVRGGLAKLAALGDACAGGVTCGSAGNHAQAVALAARERAVRCEVFMPGEAPLGKIEACRGLGAEVSLVGDTVEDAVAVARERAQDAGMAFVHPFDDEDVVAGQGTLGLEVLDDVPDLCCVVVPVGGGGLASGVAIAVKSARPEVRVVGVQIERGVPTIADGIAVKHPGAITGPLLERWLDDLVTVGDDAIAEAMVVLMEKAKLVVEGAGAVGAAALLGGQATPPRTGTTCVVLSGGNVDAGLLAMVARRQETESGRRLVFVVRVPDRPRALARLLDGVGTAGANLLDVVHLREGLDLHVRETAVQLVVETRGRDHAALVLDAVRRIGYDPQVLGAAAAQSDPTQP